MSLLSVYCSFFAVLKSDIAGIEEKQTKRMPMSEFFSVVVCGFSPFSACSVSQRGKEFTLYFSHEISP